MAIISNSEPAQPLEEERLRKEIAELRAKLNAFLSLTLSIYVTRTEKTARSTPAVAVMFCLMDVSGSMDQSTKDMANVLYSAVSVPQQNV